MVKDNLSLVYSALFLGIAALCRPVIVYFFIFLLGVFYLQFRKNLRAGILKYSMLILIFSLTLVPWMIRNYIVFGKFLVSSIQDKVLIWHFPAVFNKKQIKKINFPNRRYYIKSQGKNKKSEIFLRSILLIDNLLVKIWKINVRYFS